MYLRGQTFDDIGSESSFLWGARQTGKSLILVSNDPLLSQIGTITAMPWNIFLDKLWAGEIIV